MRLNPSWLGPPLLAGLALLVLAGAGYRMVTVSLEQLRQPFDLIYESPNLRTIQLIQEGKNIYDPAVYADVPFVLTIYTPLYHFLVAALPGRADNLFWTARLVAFIFMILAPLPLLFVGDAGHYYLPILGIALFWLMWPITNTAAFIKSDSMGLFFAIAAVVTASRVGTWRSGILVAAILCWLALASKQYYVAPALACFLGFFCSERKSAWLFAGTYLGLCLVSGLFALAWWGNGVVYSLLAGARQPMLVEVFLANWQAMLREPLFLVLILLVHVMLLVVVWRAPRQSWRSPLVWYFLVSAAVMLTGLSKLGSTVNYFFEPLLAGLMLWIVAQKGTSSRPVVWVTPLVLVAAAAWELLGTEPLNYTLLYNMPVDPRLQASSAAELRNHLSLHPAANPIPEVRKWMTQRRAAEVADLAGKDPRILNLFSAHLGGELPGTVSLNDPYLYTLLWEFDQLRGEGMVEALESRYFDLIIVRAGFDPEPSSFRGQAFPAIVQALRRNYRFARPGLDGDYWVPVAAK